MLLSHSKIEFKVENMKISRLTLVVAIALLTGCSNMMYGGGIAPVANQNTYYGHQQAQQMPNYQPPVTQALPTSTVVNQQPAQTAVYRVPTPPYSVRNSAENYGGGIQESSSSPYATTPVRPTAVQNNTANVDDGWSVRPNNTRNEAPPSVTDTPKVAEETSTNNTTLSESRSDARPVRPVQQEVVKQSVSDEVSAPASENRTNNNSQESDTKVAKATNPPAQNKSGGTAVSSLLKQANAELGKGNLDGAVSYLENAHRIDSKNAKILYDIANIRYHQGRYRDAENMAVKSIREGGSNAMMKKSWSLIANARKALGDNQGAILAAEKAASY